MSEPVTRVTMERRISQMEIEDIAERVSREFTVFKNELTAQLVNLDDTLTMIANRLADIAQAIKEGSNQQ